MKKTLILMVMATMVMLAASGCALHQAGYKADPEIVRATVPPSAPAPKPDPTLAQISQKLDILINKISTPLTQPVPPQPQKIIKFQPSRTTARKNDLEKRVARNERKIAEISQTLVLQGKFILEQGGKYKIVRIGLFPAGVADLKCTKKGCNMEKQIEEAILQAEKEGYTPSKIIGYTDDDGWEKNKEISKKRAEVVYEKTLLYRPNYRNLNIEVIGGGPTRMFGLAPENRCTLIFFKKKQ